MVIAKEVKENPLEIAKIINNQLSIINKKLNLFEKIEVVKPGFINFFVSKEYLQRQVEEILRKKDKYGQLKIGKRKKVNVEFISANPTGPLHIGNARGGFCGDVLANLLEKAGYKPFREYYVNDMGRQIEILKNSLEGKQPSYLGPHIDFLKKKKVKNIQEAIKIILEKYIKTTVEKMGIKFDKWFFESELYKKKEIEKVLDFLKKKKLTYEKEGALWFKSTKFGDDKDRVLIKTGDKETYFLSDVAYLENKFKRGFKLLIIFLGAEHHGYTGRLIAAAKALGYNPENVKPIIMQLVKLLERGREVRMSKRTGIYVTIDELIDEVGVDVSRFFFLTRNYDSHLIFDLDLAKEQSEKNPVYYIQYAHARICSILKKAPKYNIRNAKYELLNHPSELNLIKQLIRLPEIIEDTTKDYQVQRLPRYATDLATAFHQFYRDCKVLLENNSLSQARLALVLATKTILKNTLDLMGLSAPEKM
jgi:arginyl-tRNA synthetase